MASVIEQQARERDVTPKELGRPTQGMPLVWFELPPVVDDRTTPEGARPSARLMPSLVPSVLNDILRQIADLSSGDEADEYGVLRPTDHAIGKTMEVLVRAWGASFGQAVRQATRLPPGCVTTDERGGLRIEWSEDGRAVHLVIPAEPGGRSYIYHELGEVYGAEDRVAGSVLAYWLQRLFG